MAHIQTSALIPAPRAVVYNYVSDFKHLPEWVGETIQVSFTQIPETAFLGQEFEMQMARFGVTQKVTLRIEQVKTNELIVDRQVHGFFQHWLHSQRLSEHSANATLLTDTIDYAMPYGLIGQFLDDVYVRHDLTHILNQRYERIIASLSRASST